ncbi:MAG: hypothetical protein NTU66_07190, partial [Elusimicrobia bacterium]|nr:hypothetical protein [Elusimicrobiota bacterium]
MNIANSTIGTNDLSKAVSVHENGLCDISASNLLGKTCVEVFGSAILRAQKIHVRYGGQGLKVSDTARAELVNLTVTAGVHAESGITAEGFGIITINSLRIAGGICGIRIVANGECEASGIEIRAGIGIEVLGSGIIRGTGFDIKYVKRGIAVRDSGRAELSEVKTATGELGEAGIDVDDHGRVAVRVLHILGGIYGVRINGNGGITIDDGEISATTISGIDINGLAHVIVRGMRIDAGETCGIRIGTSGECEASGIEIRAGICIEVLGSGIIRGTGFDIKYVKRGIAVRDNGRA